MELRPADLGGDLAVSLIEARVTTYQSTRRSGAFRNSLGKLKPKNPQNTIGTYERWLTKGSGLTGENQSRAATAIVPMTQGMLIGGFASSIGFLIPLSIFISQGEFGPALMFGAMLTGMTSLFVGMPITLARRWMSAPLNEEELVNLIVAKDGNSLQQAYLRLVREVLKQTNIPEEAQDGLRDALRSLSDAMSKLPAVSGMSNSTPEELRRNAEAVHARANAETDLLTQASLSRQADALDRTAQAAERSAVLIKRTKALQEELAAQIEALRLGLTAFYTGDTDVSGLAMLSENVRTVAAEAVSVSAARAELDSVSSYTAPVAPQAQPLRVGR